MSVQGLPATPDAFFDILYTATVRKERMHAYVGVHNLYNDTDYATAFCNCQVSNNIRRKI